MQRRRVRFTGRVQGVGFRMTARLVARQFPITGWVRNEPDGSVLLEAQGLAADLDAFLEALRGEMGKLIAEVDVQAVAGIQEEAGFEIRR